MTKRIKKLARTVPTSPDHRNQSSPSTRGEASLLNVGRPGMGTPGAPSEPGETHHRRGHRHRRRGAISARRGRLQRDGEGRRGCGREENGRSGHRRDRRMRRRGPCWRGGAGCRSCRHGPDGDCHLLDVCSSPVLKWQGPPVGEEAPARPPVQIHAVGRVATAAAL